jgi:hypothetical protein
VIAAIGSRRRRSLRVETVHSALRKPRPRPITRNPCAAKVSREGWLRFFRDGHRPYTVAFGITARTRQAIPAEFH